MILPNRIMLFSQVGVYTTTLTTSASVTVTMFTSIHLKFVESHAHYGF